MEFADNITRSKSAGRVTKSGVRTAADASSLSKGKDLSVDGSRISYGEVPTHPWGVLGRVYSAEPNGYRPKEKEEVDFPDS